jgi:hypothetical protein
VATSTTTKIAPNVRFGGFHDVGSQYEVASSASLSGQVTLDGHDVAAYPITWSALTTGQPVQFTATNRYYRPGMRLRFSSAGTHPDITAATTDYYVVAAVDSGTETTVSLSTSRNGDTLTSAAGGTPSGSWTASVLPQHINSTMAGMRIRFTSGTLNGLSYPLTDNTLESNGNLTLRTGESMGATPAEADTFVIEPMPVGGEVPAWDEWGFFLPECRMDGPAANTNLSAIAVTLPAVSSGTAVTMTATIGQLYEGARIRIYDSYNLITAAAVNSVPVTGSITGAGQLLFVKNYNYASGSFNVSTTYGGDSVDDATIVSGITLVAWLDEHPDRGNPMPPGFNYDNVDPIPKDYNPYYGSSTTQFPNEFGASFTTSLALRMHQHIGEEVYLVHANIPATSLARREAYDGDLLLASSFAHGWFDKAAQLDWSPNSEADNCFAMMKKKLIAAKRAAEAAGDTLECLGVWNLQGEADASSVTHANAYEDNLRAFVREVRELLVDQGMWSGSASYIPWWQPLIPTGAGYVDWGNTDYATTNTVNTAISNLADEDTFFTTRTLSDATIGFDGIHYRGDYLFTLGEYAFTDWLAVAAGESARTRVDISNQALKNLGETKPITSLTEDTAAARLCNRYYDVALQSMLESFPWPFATETKKLTANATNARSGIDWQYAYTLPVNFLSVVTIGPDVAGANVIGEADFDIEGSVLYCNLDDIVLRYTVKAPDPSKYSQHFTNALAAKLAAEIAPGLMQGETGVQMAGQMEQRAVYFVGLAQQFSALRERNTDNNARVHPFDNPL